MNYILQGDCLKLMKDLADGSVDAIITDPPYGTVKGIRSSPASKTTGLKENMWDESINHKEMLEECNRVLRPKGVLILFSQDPYTGKLMTEQHGNLPFSYRLTWLKDHFANCLLAKKAPLNYTEDICIFFKKYDTLAQHPLRKYSEKIMDHIGLKLKQINTSLGHRKAEHFFYVDSTQFGLCTEGVYNELITNFNLDKEDWFKPYKELYRINEEFRFKVVFNLSKGKKFKSNVLEYKKDYNGLHPTQKPVDLIKDLVETYTNKGDMVLDFTCGSGTTNIACLNTNRRCIGMEMDKKYFEIATKRLAEAKEKCEPSPYKEVRL